MAKQSQMYSSGGKRLSLMQYLQRGQRRAKRAKALQKQGKDISYIAKDIGTTEERVKQILGNGIDYQGKR